MCLVSRYLLKGVRERVFSTVNVNNNVRWSIYIHKLDFLSDLPSKLDTVCQLEDYQNLIYYEKKKLFDMKSKDFSKKLKEVYDEYLFLIDLEQELGIEDSNLEDIWDLYLNKIVKGDNQKTLKRK